jgi:predicted Zn-dependent protease
MSQISRNDMGAAVATLRSYRRQYPEEKSFFASLINEAEALITLGDPQSAAAALKEADVDKSPERARAQWMIMRLGSAAAPAEAPATENPASSEKASEPAAAAPAAEQPQAESTTPSESKSETPVEETSGSVETTLAATAIENPVPPDPPAGNAPGEK